MKCPTCGYKYVCPCEACSTRLPDLLPKWIRTNMSADKNDWYESCPKCGDTRSVYDWMDEDYRQMRGEG